MGYKLNIVAPALSNYIYNVLLITHPAIFVYPITVYPLAERIYECEAEESFIKILGEILSSEEIHKAIMGLLFLQEVPIIL